MDKLPTLTSSYNSPNHLGKILFYCCCWNSSKHIEKFWNDMFTASYPEMSKYLLCNEMSNVLNLTSPHCICCPIVNGAGVPFTSFTVFNRSLHVSLHTKLKDDRKKSNPAFVAKWPRTLSGHFCSSAETESIWPIIVVVFWPIIVKLGCFWKRNWADIQIKWWCIKLSSQEDLSQW